MLNKLYDKVSCPTFILSFIISIILTVLEFKIVGYMEEQDILLFFILNMVILIFMISILDKFFGKVRNVDKK